MYYIGFLKIPNSIMRIVINIKFVDENFGMKMIVNSAAPLSLVSADWLKKYVRDTEVEDNELEWMSCLRQFRLGENVYESSSMVSFPIVIKAL